MAIGFRALSPSWIELRESSEQNAQPLSLDVGERLGHLAVFYAENVHAPEAASGEERNICSQKARTASCPM